jgi:DNA ligase-1
VTLIDATHCPGAVQVLFQLPDNGPTYLHCGDMRFTPSLLANPALVPARGCEGVFLDTTYCNPRHTFPPQVGGAWVGVGRCTGRFELSAVQGLCIMPVQGLERNFGEVTPRQG